ncbi:MAG TPA: undecaprenyl-diphosphate phosphatase [Candidatus Saccharimonadales bacterium]|nr:undecaprenyl-diphosphate phosphatase [Candidatus Saccharimonadales bacterium]
MTDVLQAILLGIIEGLTEFLPVSSTGHLIIAEDYLNFKDTAKVFTVVIQLGAILAVVWYYRSDLIKKIGGLFGGGKHSQRFLANLIIASIPAGLLGLALDKNFEKYATPKVVAFALIAGAAVLWWADNREKKREHVVKERNNLDEISLRQALFAGVAQCAALIPGVSRSGASIVGGLFGGMNRVTATAFSFYLAIPILGGASLYKLVTDRGDMDAVSGGGASIAIGLITSFIVALVAISWLLKYVSTHSFRIFVYWRIAVGVLVLALLL